ncbi:PP2C family serine/threonine-protein phosphatase [Bacillus sp. 31A1R]|uniref:PP2C family serine/threonine-protein phosphatase n=1 Tax=Robertmurraya mangrovi TaxID=3098077 RepID=A0ABU5J5A8_9BACI|nr:PP2C family serine/threonine-protein phosphatase [Bacillus sp. 31A1R]MDZ5474572.1 PP2C family serine/threonine-protein phosphatase [Bacillus sp. 31A1R]
MTYLNQKNIEAIAHQTTKQGNTLCGDSYFFAATDEYFICVLADGLGSGKYANEASSAVIEVVEQYQHEDVNSIMSRCNEVLFHKRGAAVAVFKVDFIKKEFVYSCVGNIRFFLYTKNGRLTYPLPVTGYLSGKPQKFHTQRYPYEGNSKFLVYSDGINLQGVKALLKSYMSVERIAEEIKRNHTSHMDDATFILGSLL